jgi:hypothetical protein
MRERKQTNFSANRLRAVALVGMDLDESGVRIMLGIKPRSAHAFSNAIRSGRDDVLHHGNLGRTNYDQARDLLFNVLSDAPKGAHVVAHRFCAWLRDEGIPCPSVRTVRWWQRDLYGVVCRRRKRKRRTE